MLLVLALSCSGNPYGKDVVLGEDLGEWAAADLSCGSVDDCFSGEACVDGTCQVERCATNLSSSAPPMGKSFPFFQEVEFGFADTTQYQGSFWIDQYAPEGGEYEFSLEASGRMTDITGGNFDGERIEGYAAAVEGQERIAVLGTTMSANPGFVPVAIDAGDVDGDGLDEVIAIAQEDEIAVCHLDTGSCDLWGFEDRTRLQDVAVADIDGDGFEEPVVLLGTDPRYLYAFHPHAELTGEELDYYDEVENDELLRITAGDIDGDFKAEVIGLKDPYWCLWCEDELHVWDSIPDGTWSLRYYSGVADDLNDIAAGDTDRDDIVEIVTIGAGNSITVEDPGQNRFTERYSANLSVSSNPNRVAMADHDGDAPRARLVEGPQAVEGGIVPTMVIGIPPYHRDYSTGTAGAGYGEGESVNESLTDTVSMGLDASIGTSPSFFGLFGTDLSAKTSYGSSSAATQSKTLAMGNRYFVSANESYGPDYGAVVIGWGCFDAYRYEMDDPSNHIGGDGEPIVITVPTGGSQALYSTTRYNALAEANGNLPLIEMPYTIGDPSSYPTRPERLNGKKIPEEDLVFLESNAYTVSDVGSVGWFNIMDESNANSEATNWSLGASAGITAFGVKVGGGYTEGWGSSYSLSIGQNALFYGSVPPMPDNLATPEDEYAANAFTVTPWVYRETWEDEDGNPLDYLVMTYSVEE